VDRDLDIRALDDDALDVIDQEARRVILDEKEAGRTPHGLLVVAPAMVAEIQRLRRALAVLRVE